jgi:hypothetical protein
MPPSSEDLGRQVVWLVVLSLPVASVAWTITHEEVFREPREFCVRKSRQCATLLTRKFFYLFTCEYCFSHYVAALAVWLTRYKLLLDDWRGYVVAFFSVVALANTYIGLYLRLRIDIRNERAEAEAKERQARSKDEPQK